MPPQNPLTRLEAVAAGLGALASELEKAYGAPAPNLVYWRNELVEVIDELLPEAEASSRTDRAAATDDPKGALRRADQM
jgi:hypothetical protein